MQLIPHSFRRISPLATPAGMAFQTPIISNHVSNPSTPHSSHKACNGQTQRWLVGLVTFHYRIKYWAITFLLHFGLSQYQVELITMSYRSGCHFPTSHRAAAPKTRSQDTYLQYPYRFFLVNAVNIDYEAVIHCHVNDFTWLIHRMKCVSLINLFFV